MEKITIELDVKWQRIARSPLYFVVAAFQGVAVSFAPLFLYWCAKGMFTGYEWFVVPCCFAVIIFVALFYYLLGGAVIRELRKK